MFYLQWGDIDHWTQPSVRPTWWFTWFLWVSKGSTFLDLGRRSDSCRLLLHMGHVTLQSGLATPKRSRAAFNGSAWDGEVWPECSGVALFVVCEAAGDEDEEPSLDYLWMFCSSFQTWWAPPSGFCPISQHAALPDMQHQCLTQDFSLLCH